MRSAIGRLARVRRAASRSVTGCVAVAAIALAAASTVHAQSSTPEPQAPAGSPADAFLTRAAYTFGWDSLGSSDPRFDWRATVDFDLDVVEYGTGRLRFHGSYEAVLGHERRRFDLNQGGYGFEVSASAVRPAVEIAGFLSHVSRHISDRELQTHVGWNGLGGRIRSRWTPSAGFSGAPDPRVVHETTIDGEAEVVRAMQQSFVDYAWMTRARVSASRPASALVDVIATAAVELVAVKDGGGRDRCACGGRAEAGVRIRGTGAALEATVGFERRIDAYPTERVPLNWLDVGVRVVSRDHR